MTVDGGMPQGLPNFFICPRNTLCQPGIYGQRHRWCNSEYAESRCQWNGPTDALGPTGQPDVGCVSRTVVKGIPSLIYHHSKPTFKNQGLIKVVYPSVLPYALLLRNVKVCGKSLLVQKTLTPEIIQSIWHLPYTLLNKSVLWKHDIGQNMPRESLEVVLNDLEKQPVGVHCKAVLLIQAVFVSSRVPWKETIIPDQQRESRESFVLSVL